LQDISFFAVGSNMLLNESVENKQIVQQAFMDGLNNSVIQPYRNNVITTSMSDSNIFDTMR